MEQETYPIYLIKSSNKTPDFTGVHKVIVNSLFLQKCRKSIITY